MNNIEKQTLEECSKEFYGNNPPIGTKMLDYVWNGTAWEKPTVCPKSLNLIRKIFQLCDNGSKAQKITAALFLILVGWYPIYGAACLTKYISVILPTVVWWFWGGCILVLVLAMIAMCVFSIVWFMMFVACLSRLGEEEKTYRKKVYIRGKKRYVELQK